MELFHENRIATSNGWVVDLCQQIKQTFHIDSEFTKIVKLQKDISRHGMELFCFSYLLLHSAPQKLHSQ